MNEVFSTGCEQYKNDVDRILADLDSVGERVGNGDRNLVKKVIVQGRHLNIKSFKRPNLINKVVYRYFRKSKARRSFENAHFLMRNGFHTPVPIAYIEQYDVAGLGRSYYISEQLEDYFTLQPVVYDPEFRRKEYFLKEYTRLIFSLHQLNVEIIDNSAGNFLIKEENGNTAIYLVDLNRMNFHKKGDNDWKLKNFWKMPADHFTTDVISKEYARLSGLKYEDVYAALIAAAAEFEAGRAKKRQLKKLFKFYRRTNILTLI